MSKSKTKLITGLALALVLILSACGGGNADTPQVSQADQVRTQAAETVQQSLTQTAAVQVLEPSATPMPSPTVEPTEEETAEADAIPTNALGDALTEAPTDAEGEGEETAGQPTQAANQPLATNTTAAATLAPSPTPIPVQEGGNSDLPCYRASLEWENTPDGTEFPVDKLFTKLWRIKNTGSCTWTSNFSLIFVDGDLMDAKSVVPLTELNVDTWGYVEIEVPMKAPSPAGTYKGYWMIRSADGNVFGIGPDGKSWIWVEIKSFVPDT